MRILVHAGAMVFAVVTLGGAPPDKLVYADFEKVENGRPVSTRGGTIQLWAGEDDHVHKATVKGAEGLNPPGPEVVRIKADDPNHAAKFDYALQAPNPWTLAMMEIHGLPDADGKPQGDDVSGYKYLSLDIYATGIRLIRIEMRSNESGKDTRSAFPMYQIEVKSGLNTYRIPLAKFTQPSWDSVRVDPKESFKRLTSVAVIAFCDQCEQPMQGMVILDNIVFEK